ncbi:ADP-ribosyl-[dinitrogen reductase] hydrolase [Oryzomonas sagensis]|uniref:ADP-ribosyl-[dinitrogen reductase] hydrolase n=1 Tax=Oryzomonas sagensis TaxID=2603857 RepID=A0ABQ6TNU7_9BACT|nr:ADP-ribosylglycohydrolase family protein [Oryzomonas sagensis]KAB0670075.1 ADP-ribosyl-[dinitrogen reductase] hydrolase [Oryzomonas sagensis]
MDNNEKFNRVAGSLIGFACGDACGALVEFMTPGEIRKKYGRVVDMLPGGWIKGRLAGECTDDTQMALCVARSLVSTCGEPDYKDMSDRLLEWLDSKPKDVGSACRRGLEAYRKTGSLCNGDDTTLGNGGLLRVLPFALAGRTWQEAMGHVELTHNTSLQARAVQSYVLALQAASAGGDKRDIGMEIRGIGIRPVGVKNNRGDVKNSLSSALNWFFTTDTFEDCITQAVNAGHDADSVAALAGGLAGCHYGLAAIPERWSKALDPVVRIEALELAVLLGKF